MILPANRISAKTELAARKKMLQERISLLCWGFVFLCFIFILVFAHLSYGGVENWHVSVLALVSVLVFLAWTGSFLVADPSKPANGAFRKTTVLVFSLPVLFVILIVAQLVSLPESILGVLSPARAALNKLTGIEGNSPVSIAPYTTKIWLLRVVICVIVFAIAAHTFSDRKRALYVIAVIVIFGYANAIYGILLHLSDYTLPSLFQQRHFLDRATGTYVNPNHFAGYLEMCTPLAISILFIGRRHESDQGITLRRRVVRFFSEKFQDKKFLLPLTAVMVMSLALIFSMSRMGIFAFTVSVVLFALIVGRRHERARFVILGVVAGATLLVSIWFGLNPVLRRYSLLGGDVEGRTEAWKMTGNIIADYPVLGTGLGTFTHISPTYQRESTKHGHWAESHNDYLNLLSDTGIAGFAVGIGFLLAWYVYVFRLLSRKHLRTYQRSIAAGCIAGVTGIVLHSVTDFNLQIPVNAFYFATLLGLALAVLRINDFQPDIADKSEKPGPESVREGCSGLKRQPVFARLALFAAAVLLFVVVTPFALKTASAELSLENDSSLEYSESRIRALERTISQVPDNPELRYRLGMARYRDCKEYDKARDSFSRAVLLAPSTGKYHFRLGMAYARLGNDLLSEQELYLAKKFAPVHPDLHFKIAYYHFFKARRMSDPELMTAALAEFKTVANLDKGYLWKSLELVNIYMPQYEYLTRLTPDTAEHRQGIANFLASKKRWAEALAEYQRVWSLKMQEDFSYVGDERLFLQLARCHLMTGNTEDAKKGYIKACGLAGIRQQIFRTIRYDFAEAKLLKDGLSLLCSLRPEFPKDDTLELEIAKTHFVLGEYDTAEKLLLSLSNWRPCKEIYQCLFHIAMQRRDYNLAEVYAGGAIRFMPHEAAHYAMLAHARSANRDYKGAVQALKQALAIEPKNMFYKEEMQKVNDQMLFQKK